MAGDTGYDSLAAKYGSGASGQGASPDAGASGYQGLAAKYGGGSGVPPASPPVASAPAANATADPTLTHDSDLEDMIASGKGLTAGDVQVALDRKGFSTPGDVKALVNNYRPYLSPDEQSALDSRVQHFLGGGANGGSAPNTVSGYQNDKLTPVDTRLQPLPFGYGVGDFSPDQQVRVPGRVVGDITRAIGALNRQGKQAPGAPDALAPLIQQRTPGQITSTWGNLGKIAHNVFERPVNTAVALVQGGMDYNQKHNSTFDGWGQAADWASKAWHDEHYMPNPADEGWAGALKTSKIFGPILRGAGNAFSALVNTPVDDPMNGTWNPAEHSGMTPQSATDFLAKGAEFGLNWRAADTISALGGILPKTASVLLEGTKTGKALEGVGRGVAGFLNPARGFAPELQQLNSKYNAALDSRLKAFQDIQGLHEGKLTAEGLKAGSPARQAYSEGQFLKNRSLQNTAQELTNPQAAASAVTGKPPTDMRIALGPLPADVSLDSLKTTASLHGLDDSGLLNVAKSAGYDSLQSPEARRAVLGHLRLGNITPEAVAGSREAVNSALGGAGKPAGPTGQDWQWLGQQRPSVQPASLPSNPQFSPSFQGLHQQMSVKLGDELQAARKTAFDQAIAGGATQQAAQKAASKASWDLTHTRLREVAQQSGLVKNSLGEISHSEDGRRSLWQVLNGQTPDVTQVAAGKAATQVGETAGKVNGFDTTLFNQKQQLEQRIGQLRTQLGTGDPAIQRALEQQQQALADLNARMGQAADANSTGFLKAQMPLVTADGQSLAGALQPQINKVQENLQALRDQLQTATGANKAAIERSVALQEKHLNDLLAQRPVRPAGDLSALPTSGTLFTQPDPALLAQRDKITQNIANLKDQLQRQAAGGTPLIDQYLAKFKQWGDPGFDSSHYDRLRSELSQLKAHPDWTRQVDLYNSQFDIKKMAADYGRTPDQMMRQLRGSPYPANELSNYLVARGTPKAPPATGLARQAVERSVTALEGQLKDITDRLNAQGKAFTPGMPKPPTSTDPFANLRPGDTVTGAQAGDVLARRGELQLQVRHIENQLARDSELSQSAVQDLLNQKQQLQGELERLRGVNTAAPPAPVPGAPAHELQGIDTAEKLRDYLQANAHKMTAEDVYQTVAKALPQIETGLTPYQLRDFYFHLGSMPGAKQTPRTLFDALGNLSTTGGFQKAQNSATLTDYANAIREMGRTPLTDVGQSLGHRLYTGSVKDNMASMFKEIAANPDWAASAEQAAAKGLEGQWTKIPESPMFGDLSGKFVSPDAAKFLEWRALNLTPHADGLNSLDKVQNFLRSTFFINPAIHAPKLMENAALSGVNPLNILVKNPEAENAMIAAGRGQGVHGFGNFMQGAGTPLEKPGLAQRFSNWNRGVVTQMEKNLSGAMFDQLVSQGVPREEAAARAARAFADHGLFGDTQGKWARRGFTTPSWTVNNLLFQAQNRLEHPGRYWALQQGKEAWNKAVTGHGSSENGPGNEMNIPLPSTNQQGARYYTTPNLPSDDLDKLWSNPRGFALNRVAPVPGGLWDLSGLWDKKPAEDLNHGLDYSLGQKGPLLGYGLQGFGPPVPLPVQQAVGRFIPRYAGDIGRAAMTPQDLGTAKQSSPWTLAPDLLLGMQTRPVDRQAAYNRALYQYRDQLQKSAGLQGVKVPRAPRPLIPMPRTR